MTAIRTRLEALESAVRPAAAVMLDLERLTADDREFMAGIGIGISETDSGQPDYSALSVPDLQRLLGIAERFGSDAP